MFLDELDLRCKQKKLHFYLPFHIFFLLLQSDWLRPVREILKEALCLLVSREPEKFNDFNKGNWHDSFCVMRGMLFTAIFVFIG